MKNTQTYLMLAALAMRTDLTPEEQKIFNQFLRGSDKIAD